MSEDETTGADTELPEFDIPGDSASQETTQPGSAPQDDTSQEDIPLQEMIAPEKSAPVPLTEKTAAELESVFDIPVRVSVILGRARIPVADLLKMDTGTVIELDRQVGEAIEVYVNDRLIARGEIVLVEDKLGVTMTEIIKAA